MSTTQSEIACTYFDELMKSLARVYCNVYYLNSYVGVSPSGKSTWGVYITLIYLSKPAYRRRCGDVIN